MGIIEKHNGCPVDPTNITGYCMGPKGEYWTVFGSELRFLGMHIIGAVFTGTIVFFLLRLASKRNYADLSVYLQVLLGFVTIPLVFLLLAYLFPVEIWY